MWWWDASCSSAYCPFHYFTRILGPRWAPSSLLRMPLQLGAPLALQRIWLTLEQLTLVLVWWTITFPNKYQSWWYPYLEGYRPCVPCVWYLRATACCTHTFRYPQTSEQGHLQEMATRRNPWRCKDIFERAFSWPLGKIPQHWGDPHMGRFPMRRPVSGKGIWTGAHGTSLFSLLWNFENKKDRQGRGRRAYYMQAHCGKCRIYETRGGPSYF